MKGAKKDALSYDNKYSKTFDHYGTTNIWTAVENLYLPGGYGFNAYKVEVSTDTNYQVAVRANNAVNPATADFRARIVVHNLVSNERRYQNLEMLPNGDESSTSISVKAGEVLYLVVSATPDVFKGYDAYRYHYKLYPQN